MILLLNTWQIIRKIMKFASLILIILQRLSLIRDIAINSDNRALSVFHLNIRSLNSSWRSLCKFLELFNFKFDVIVLTEICAYNITYYRNILPGYQCHYALPDNSKVGGVEVDKLGNA